MPDRQENASRGNLKKDEKDFKIPATQEQEKGVPEQNPYMPPNRSDLAIKRYENLSEKKEEHKEHSLQEQAMERALHPQPPHAGTPYDWEDFEAYKKELERLDKEGPKGSETP